jgi:hypothetical protein
MHKLMSNSANVAQFMFMPQGIKGPKRLLQKAAMDKWNQLNPRPTNAGSRSHIEEYLREDGPPAVVHVAAPAESLLPRSPVQRTYRN